MYIYLIGSVLKRGSNIVCGNEGEQGHDFLIHLSIKKKAQMLKVNQYDKHGLLLSGQMEFVLR